MNLKVPVIPFKAASQEKATGRDNTYKTALRKGSALNYEAERLGTLGSVVLRDRKDFVNNAGIMAVRDSVSGPTTVPSETDGSALSCSGDSGVMQMRAMCPDGSDAAFILFHRLLALFFAHRGPVVINAPLPRPESGGLKVPTTVLKSFRGSCPAANHLITHHPTESFNLSVR
uniref:Uncharacterized protein n=3 Tax=Bursaphelenchus xylophilus TaxID=6326 RepID=A0A1I7S370_BURXY